MEEDSAEKIRRNLIVTSTAVLLGAWLQLPAASVMERLLGDKVGGSVDAWRVWLAVLAVLLYLALRFRFSQGHSGMIADAKREHQRFRLDAVNAKLHRAAGIYSKSGKDCFLFLGGLDAYVQKRLGASANTTTVRLTSIRHKPVNRGQKIPNEEFAGEGMLDITVEREGKSDSVADALEFYVSGWPLRWIYLRCLLRLFAYSEASTAILLPWALFALAFVIAIWRFVQSLI